jgi:hypothetical protein
MKGTSLQPEFRLELITHTFGAGHFPSRLPSLGTLLVSNPSPLVLHFIFAHAATR